MNLTLLYESYKEDHDKFKDILNYINKWTVIYEKERNLKFINNNDLIRIYKIADDLQTKYICNDNMGNESEYSDYVLNLIWELRICYKNDMEVNNNVIRPSRSNEVLEENGNNGVTIPKDVMPKKRKSNVFRINAKNKSL